MKQILGDNQFFGINHYDLEKGEITKSIFKDNSTVVNFITEATSYGLDGFMINSNKRGYQIANEIKFESSKEYHYSVPYPHKFASIVNETGMLSLLWYVFSKSSLISLFYRMPQFIITRDVKYLLPLILDLEIPPNLPKGSFIYLQNIVTDLLLGIGRNDLIESFCKVVFDKGYNPGIITLNPLLLDNVVIKFPHEIQQKIIICYNINYSGFNVFPSLNEVEVFTKKKKLYKKMGMSILSSGGAISVLESLKYIKKLPLDYVVYGSSRMENIKSNYDSLVK